MSVNEQMKKFNHAFNELLEENRVAFMSDLTDSSQLETEAMSIEDYQPESEETDATIKRMQENVAYAERMGTTLIFAYELFAGTKLEKLFSGPKESIYWRVKDVKDELHA